MKSFKQLLKEDLKDANYSSGKDVMCSLCTGTGTDENGNPCFGCNGHGKYFVYNKDK